MFIDRQLISAEMFREIANHPDYTDLRVELIEGQIVTMSKPGGRHGEIAMEIGRLISNHVHEHKLGRVTAAETGYILVKNPNGRDTVRGPDVGFVKIERAPQGLPEGYVPFAPDLAVEVISPGNTAEDIHNKTLQFLKAGTSLIWIVYSESRTVVEHTKGGAKTLYENDILDGKNVLPGFKVTIRDIFPV